MKKFNELEHGQTIKSRDIVLEMNPLDELSKKSSSKKDVNVEQTQPKVMSGTGGLVTQPDKFQTLEDGDDSMNIMDTLENEGKVKNINSQRD